MCVVGKMVNVKMVMFRFIMMTITILLLSYDTFFFFFFLSFFLSQVCCISLQLRFSPVFSSPLSCFLPSSPSRMGEGKGRIELVYSELVVRALDSRQAANSQLR